jgi:hypothetical protein
LFALQPFHMRDRRSLQEIAATADANLIFAHSLAGAGVLDHAVHNPFQHVRQEIEIRHAASVRRSRDRIFNHAAWSIA